MSYYSVAVDGISVLHTSNEQHTQSQDTACACDSCKYRVMFEIFFKCFAIEKVQVKQTATIALIQQTHR